MLFFQINSQLCYFKKKKTPFFPVKGISLDSVSLQSCKQVN